MPALDTARNSVLLSGIVGSTAYGLAGPDSDVDRLGTYAAPTVEFHGLYPPVGKDATVVSTNPDVTMHEVGKLAKLCLGGNPTVMELLWLKSYETLNIWGRELIGIRSSFLSAKKVRDAYLGYATAQFKRLESREDGSFSADTRKRTAKHARHLMRLCYQGYVLYCTGQLTIKLEAPQVFREFGEEVADGNIEAAWDLIKKYEDLFNGARTVLPDHPDEAVVEKWLRRVRSAHL